MRYRKLGRTNILVSAIALGCEGFMNKTAQEVVSDFEFAEKNGINFIDIYVSNPSLRTNIGKALAGRRDKFIIQGHLCSTWEDGQYLRTRDVGKTITAFDDLLHRLDTNYIDVGMIHYIDDEADFHSVFDGDIIKLAQQYMQDGKIRHIGISSHNPKIAKMAVNTGLIDVLLFSINPCYDMQPAGENVEDLWADESYGHKLHNIDKDREELYELCERLGVAIDVMKAFGGGDLLSEENSPFKKSFTAVQCVEYALTRPAVAAVMCGFRSQKEIQDALEWCDATATQRDYASVMAGMDKYTWEGHCMYCGHCAPCTSGINIADVNKFLNLAVTQEAVPETVRDHYDLLDHHASECIECGQCETRCPFGVHIVDQMRTAVEVFGK